MIKRIHGFVSGSVQGVFFRLHTTQKANELGLTGWVKNLPDGRVEFLAEGKEEKLNELISFLHKGSPSAEVHKVEFEWKKATNEFKEFKTVY
ncbi:MAG: acylphosphatase [Candidatus Diapherotrites archaeon]